MVSREFDCLADRPEMHREFPLQEPMKSTKGRGTGILACAIGSG